MKRHTLSQLLKTAGEIYKIPTINTCSIEFNNDNNNNNKLSLETQFNQLDLDRNEETKFLKRYLFEIKDDKKTLNIIDISKPIPLRSDSSLRVKSTNSALQAIITNWKEKNDDKQFLEIWNDDYKLNNINLTKFGKHEKIYNGSLVWSQNSTKIAYIAEINKTRKVASFFTSTDENLNENNYREKYSNDFVDNWGDQNADKSQSVIAIFDLETLDLKIVDILPNDISPFGLTWYKDDGIVFYGLSIQPYRLGLVYCPTRKSELFYYDLKQNTLVQLTHYNESIRSPRFSNDFKQLCWLQNRANGPHFPCSKLMLMDWDSKQTSILIDIVKEQSENGFNGIFTDHLINKCWSLDNSRIVFSTETGHNVRVISCDVESKKLTILNNDLNDFSSCDCLTFNNDWICASYQSYNKKPIVIIGKLPEKGKENEMKWNLNVSNGTLDDLEKLINIDLIKFEPDYVNKKYPHVKFEAIFIHQKERNDCLVVFPHGGPHGSFVGVFSPHVAIMVQLGYSVLLVNYRGSTGYGQDSIDCLPGDIGTQDVKDMQQAADFCMKQYNFKNAVLYGGSHGGFLSTHLIGQYPDFYKAACVRNPVVQLEAMRTLTDIPEWIITETFGIYDFDFRNRINKDEYEELIKKSPMNYIDYVKTPLLILIGDADLRVPSSQGKLYYKGLLARNKTTRLIVYKEDNHPLNKPQTTADCIINAILWYEEYLYQH